MQEKLSDILRYARSAGKKVIATIKKGEDMEDKNINIESYDGDDAVYSGSDEEYKEFLKSVDGAGASDEAEPVENTQKINLGETINIQGVLDKVKQKAVEFGEAAKNVKDDVAGKIEDFKAATAGEDDGETRFEKFEKKVGDIKSNINVGGIKNQISGSVKGSMEKIGDIKDGITSINERFNSSDEKIAELSERIDNICEKIDDSAKKLELIEINDMERNRERVQNDADLRHSVGNIISDVAEIKQAVVSVSKLNDSIFELKNAQINTKNSVAEMEESFAKLKRKCVAGITILSILSAVTIALEVLQLLS